MGAVIKPPGMRGYCRAALPGGILVGKGCRTRVNGCSRNGTGHGAGRCIKKSSLNIGQAGRRVAGRLAWCSICFHERNMETKRTCALTRRVRFAAGWPGAGVRRGCGTGEKGPWRREKCVLRVVQEGVCSKGVAAVVTKAWGIDTFNVGGIGLQ